MSSMHWTPKYYKNTVLQNVTASGEKVIFQSIVHPFFSKTAKVVSVEREDGSCNVKTGAFWVSSIRDCAKKGMLIR